MTTHNFTADDFFSNVDAVTMANGDSLYIADGVTVAADSTTANVYKGVISAGNTYSTIDGDLVASGNAFYGNSGSNDINIGANGLLATQSNDGWDVIYINGGGNTIDNAGTIEGGQIDILGVGSNLLENSGTILLNGSSIILAGSANEIKNTGTINGGTAIIIDGANGGNFITNSGAISGGVSFNNAVGFVDTLDNSGSIDGGISAGVSENTGTIDMTNSGKISGATGISLAGSGGTETIANNGVIMGHTDGILEAGTSDLSISNAAGATISGLTGIQDDHITVAQIHNAGTITSNGSNGSAIDLEGTTTGSLVVDNSGVISNSGTGFSDGVYLKQSYVTLNNSGTISATYGVLEYGGSDTVVNTGTIFSTAVAIEAVGGSMSVTNYGHITGNIWFGGGGGNVYDGSQGFVTGGSIQAAGNGNTFTGGVGAESFDLRGGTNIVVDAGGGNDSINAGNNLANITLDGGTGTDTVTLSGAGYTGFVFAADTMVNVEKLVLANGNSYHLTTDDATVAAGQTLTVDASALTGTNAVAFDGSAETDGRFVVNGGSGNDVIKTGAGNDSINGGAGNDTITSGTGNDILSGGAGVDKFLFTENAFTAADRVDGGVGNDTLSISGDYTGATALTLGATSMVNIETLVIGAGHNYAITTNDANVAAGQTLTVNASGLAATNTLTFNGAAEKDGHFKITGGKGGDVFTGGALSDTFVYTAANQSTSTHYDTINSFNYASDKLDVTGTIGAIDTKVSHTVSTASFDADIGAAATASHLLGHTAMLVSANAGTLSGHTFLVVDLNGTAGYQAGADLVIDIHGATGTLATTDFI